MGGQDFPFGVAVGGLSYLSIQGLVHSPVVGPFLREKLSMLPGMQDPRVNSCIKMDCAKVETLSIWKTWETRLFFAGAGNPRSSRIVTDLMPNTIASLETMLAL